jgi:photosystem II stability/assembly factor-like uncharacterized protein
VLTSTSIGWISSIWGSSDHDVYVASHYDSPMLHFTDVSANGWQAVSIPGNPILHVVWGTDANDIYAAGDGVWHSTDGQTWTQIYTSAPEEVFWGLWGASSSDFVVVGGTIEPNPTVGEILHTTDGGRTFVKQQLPAFLGVTSVWGSSSQDLYAGGRMLTPDLLGGVGVVHSTDGARTWNVVFRQTTGAQTTGIAQVAGTSAQNVYVATQSGVFRTVDHGATWRDLYKSRDPNAEMCSVWAADADVFVGNYAATAAQSNDDQTWNELLPGYQAYAFWGTSADDLFIGGATSNSYPPAGNPGTIMHLH